MPIWCEDKELSKYSKYKAKVDLTKIGQVASVLAGVLLGGTALARVCLCWLCMRFQTARVESCHGRDSVKKKEKQLPNKMWMMDVDGGGCRWWMQMVAEALTQHMCWDLDNFARVCTATRHYQSTCYLLINTTKH